MATDLIYKVPVRVIWLQTAIYTVSIDVQGGHLTREQTIVDRGTDNIKERKYSHLQYQVKTRELKVIYQVRSWKNVLDEFEGLHVS